MVLFQANDFLKNQYIAASHLTPTRLGSSSGLVLEPDVKAELMGRAQLKTLRLLTREPSAQAFEEPRQTDRRRGRVEKYLAV